MSADEYKAAGNKAFQSGDYTTAIEQYTKALAFGPNAVLYSNRSGAYAAMKDWKNALSDADSCISTQGDFAKGWARKATAYQGLNQFQDAADAYNKASQLDPNNATYKQSEQECLVRAKPPASSPFGAGGMANPFGQLFGPQMWSTLESDPSTRQLLSSDPSLRPALMAIQSNPNALQQHLSNPSVMTCMQVLLGLPATPQNDEEKKAQERAAAQKREDMAAVRTPTMQRQQAPVQQQEEEEEEVLEEVDEELEREKAERKLRREQADAEKEKGAVAYKNKDFVTAIKHFEEAYNIDDTNPLYLMNISACYYEQKEYQLCIDKCLETLKESGLTSQNKGKIYLRLANSYAKIHQYDNAISNYKRSILEDNNQLARKALRQAEIDKKTYEAEQYLDDAKSEEAKEAGNAAFKDGNFSLAIEHYTDALKRNPKNYKVLSNRALVYSKVMQWDKALEDCDACLAFDPKFVKAIIRKGKINHFLKNYTKALDCYRMALDIEPDNADIAEGIRETNMAIYTSNASSTMSDEERMEKAMQDPEVAMLMSDPSVQTILQRMSTDPSFAQEVMSDPQKARMIEKLVAAGIIRVG